MNKKTTGAFRSGIITATVLFFTSFIFKAVSFIAVPLFMVIGASAAYVAVTVNVLGAVFGAWAGARLAMAGREMKTDKSAAAATMAAVIASFLDLAPGIAGGVFASMSGRAGFYTSAFIQSLLMFIAIFFVARAVFKKREAQKILPVAEMSDNG